MKNGKDSDNKEQMKTDFIRLLEKKAVNGFRPLEEIMYDGWQLRFSEGFTGRVNSISIFENSTIGTDEKLDFCENAYRSKGLPCMFKLTEADREFSDMLTGRGYEVVTPTEVMFLKLKDIDLDESKPDEIGADKNKSETIKAETTEAETNKSETMEAETNKAETMEAEINRSETTEAETNKPEMINDEIKMAESIKVDMIKSKNYEIRSFDSDDGDIVIFSSDPEEWFEYYFKLEGYEDERRRKLTKRIHAKVEIEKLYVRILKGNQTVAVASTAIDEGYMLLYNVIVDKAYRGMGYGRMLCQAALWKAREMGAEYSFLQVLQDNAVANNLYKSLGFEKAYEYWYMRQKI